MEKVYLVLKSDSGDYYVTTYEVLGTYRNKENAEARLSLAETEFAKQSDISIEIVELTLND